MYGTLGSGVRDGGTDLGVGLGVELSSALDSGWNCPSRTPGGSAREAQARRARARRVGVPRRTTRRRSARSFEPLEVWVSKYLALHLPAVATGLRERVGECTRESRDDAIHLGHPFQERCGIA